MTGCTPASKALSDRARAKGALLRSRAAVTGTRRDGGGFAAETARSLVRAGQVIVATNGYTTRQPQPEFAKRIVPVRNYQIAAEPLDPHLIRNSIRAAA
jgi:glycine/D-amino acid oxidase-like deaminating enzyme